MQKIASVLGPLHERTVEDESCAFGYAFRLCKRPAKNDFNTKDLIPESWIKVESNKTKKIFYF